MKTSGASENDSIVIRARHEPECIRNSDEDLLDWRFQEETFLRVTKSFIRFNTYIQTACLSL